MKKVLSILIITALMCMLFVGCATEAPEEEPTIAPSAEASEEPAETAAPEPEETSNEESKAILVVSFGTSYNESRDITIGAIEAAITDAYPDYDVRRAFTAQTIIDILAEREGLEIDNVEQALDKLVADGISELIIQPTHLMNGYEYDDIVADVEKYKDQFDKLVIGEPLLTSNADFDAVVEAITSDTASYSNDETAIAFMGHGTHHEANAVYAKLQDKLNDAGYDNYFVGTVEGSPEIDDILPELEAGGYSKVVLQPLMVVAGDHANNDMAGDEEDSWKTILTEAGFEVEPVLRGLGEIEGIRTIYVQHVQDAIDSLNGETATADGSKVILVTSFGTSYNESRDITIGAVETAIADAYPDYEVRRAFTAQTIIDILAEREGLEIDNVEQALDRLVADGVTELIIQPTHLMNGYEYDDVVADVGKYADKFDKLIIGEPLLTSDADFDAVVEAITSDTASYSNDETAIAFMGHGTHHEANAVYAKLQDKLNDAGYDNYFIGTVEGAPEIDDILPEIEAGGYSKVVLQPLMVVAGDHANNDMAGDEEDSWKTILEEAGFEVEPILRGLGELPGIQTIYVQHVQDAIDSLAAGGGVSAGSADGGAAGGTQLNDGTYTIEVESSSSMFKVVDAQLTVKDGEMTAVLTLSGTGYEKLYMGTGEEALGDSDDKCIYFVEDADGAYTYEVPVAALDQDIDVAAWSIRKQEWYDRVLVFHSASLPDDAFAS